MGLEGCHGTPEGDKALIRLAETPVQKRPIEMALNKRKSAPGSYKRIYTFDPSKNSR